MPGIGIIANPYSKQNRRNPERSGVLGYILGEKGQLRTTGSLDELSEVAREFLQRKIDILAINGGDGTVSRTLTAFRNAYGATPLPPVALLKGGTMNAIATNLKLKGNPEDILFRLVEGFSGPNSLPTRRLSSLQIDGIIGFIFANGTATNFLKAFYRKKTGPIGAILLIVRTMLQGAFGRSSFADIVEQRLYDISTGQHHDRAVESCCTMVSTVPKLPMGAPLFHAMKNQTGQMELLSFVDRPRDLVWKLPWYAIKNWRDSMIPRRAGPYVQISAGRSFWYTLDGELFEASHGQVNIDLGPDIDFVIV